MAMEGLRGYLQLASGLAEMSRAKATEAASALLSLSAGLSGGGGPGRNVQGQVQDLAEELLAAAAANRRSLIALIRSEVERAVVSSGLPADELDRARAAVAKLSADVEELRAQVLANPAVGEVASRLGLGGHGQSRPADPFAGAADEGFGSTRADSGDGVVVDAVFTEPVDEPVAAPPRRRPPRKQIADQAATRPASAGTGAASTPAATKAAPATQTARRGAAKKSAARKTGATRRRPRPPRAKKAAAKTATATKGRQAVHEQGDRSHTRPPRRRPTTTKTATKKTATKKAATQEGRQEGRPPRRRPPRRRPRRRPPPRRRPRRRPPPRARGRLVTVGDGDTETDTGAVASAALEAPPLTGDAAVDAALQRLYDGAESGSLDDQAEAGEAAHRALQDRLADLGGD